MIGTALAQSHGDAAAHAEPFYYAPEFWVAVSFVIFIALAAKPVWGIVTKALDKDIDAIRNQLDEAARLREEAQDLLSSYKRKLAEAQKEAEGIVSDARDEAQRLRAKMTEDLEASLVRREQLAMNRISQAEAEATAEVRAMASDVALRAARRIISDNVSGEKADELIDKAITDLPNKLN